MKTCRAKPVIGRELKDTARHVVKFGDGSYLSPNLRYGSRIRQQRFAMRWLTWASALLRRHGCSGGPGGEEVRPRLPQGGGSVCGSWFARSSAMV